MEHLCCSGEQSLAFTELTVMSDVSHTFRALTLENGFQDKTLETLIRQAENYTSILFCNTYRNMALEAAASVQEFFADVSLYLFGADVNPEEFVNRFFDSLFPLVYNHLINPGVTDSSLEYSECIRAARQDISPFGNIPKRVMGQMGRSLLPSRTFLQALNLGIEVINTTDHLHFSRECSGALLRMQYCPHCQGLALSKPCTGYCLNVMRGCLAHMAELNPHWHAYIRSLEELSDAMHGTYDIEHVLLNFHLLVNDAVMQAHLGGQKLLEQVNKICGHPIRTPTQSPRCSFDGSKEKHGMKISARNGEETLANRRKDFINSLRLYRTFYGGLADQLCVNELAAADGQPCWDGEDLVKSPQKFGFSLLVSAEVSLTASAAASLFSATGRVSSTERRETMTLRRAGGVLTAEQLMVPRLALWSRYLVVFTSKGAPESPWIDSSVDT
ncbi:Glypican-5 [Galemys pyrenaicus]|uniref:Glypican-5 n=1 Tax=Galemys pyrenaicus TaxID=202257 RepID=A0A8J6AG35_GALPY|nr:Glypican-5 [Galemys pyrenaicus]